MKSALRISLVGLLLLQGACGIQPWVKPYERGRVADPIMSWDRDAVSAAYVEHIHDWREGARGATVTAPRGCGCN